MSNVASPKFLVFAGSTRKDSYNKKLAQLTAQGLRANNIDVTYLDLSTLPMPLYDGDLEASQGVPENALKFRQYLKDHHAFVMCCPEYNSSISAVLKNAIDWASRPIPGEPNLVCFVGKVVSLLSASPGKWGGMRGLVTTRSILSSIGAIVLPDQLCIPFADKAFNADGTLVNAKEQEVLSSICCNLVEIVSGIKFQTEQCIKANQAES